ncbi:eCIS core domain-containing protein [Leptothoe spongobia]|uniref:DUF4157 domain-containing protein n=1 Tax=Leptothoe spongobia TAU-MAC 1115 TaxID=1967444 RepID=A0A947DG08_9CYAN|nr:DUF4157 domain-containing protein [Leptothoe spongobia]MBT9315964.1 DUF4157 domain-containing protein [Leptothoe spongobia TAU-MAC 1115]
MKTSHRFPDPQKGTAPQLQNALQTRPFASQPATEPTQLDGQTPQSLSFSFADIDIVQPKVTIGTPNDPLEKEADAVAHQVVDHINAGPLTPVPTPPSAPPGNPIQRSPLSSTTRLVPDPLLQVPVQRQGGIVSGEASSDFESQLNHTRGGGSPLQPQLQSQMESAMGANLSNVRVHTDSQANQLSQSIQAKAFTTGADIYFKQGEYNPSSRNGQELIAHEVTHTLQQGATQQIQQQPQRKPEQVSPLATGIIQRVTENDSLTAPTGNSTGTAFNNIVTAVDSYNTHSLSYEPLNLDNPDEVKKSKFRRRIDDLDGISRSIDTWLTAHPEKENTFFSNKTKRERRNNKRASMQELKQSVVELLNHIQEQLTIIETQIQTEQAFEDAPLQDDPKLRQQDEAHHKIKETQSALHFVPGGTQAFFPMTRENLGIQADVQVHIINPVQGQQNFPNHVAVKLLQGRFNQHICWVAKTDLTEIKTESERYKKVDVELFPDGRDPDPNDVKQTNLGDCYFQAALMSIATTRPQYFKKIMRDQEDAVAVRLFQVQSGGNGEKTFTPQYIKVEKSIPQSQSGQKLYNQGQLWVKMMQKAYVAGGFAGTLEEDNQSQSPSYDDIAGGLSSHAFEVLLGEASEHTSLNQRSDNDPAGETLAKIGEVFEKNGLSTSGNTFAAVQGMLFLKESTRQNLGGDVAVQVTLEEVDKAFKQGSQEENGKKEVVLKALAKYLPGKLGKGQYTEFQTGLFTNIQVALKAGQPVTMSTHKYIEATQSGFNGAAGEQKKGGLAGRHAYSVLQTCTSDDISAPALGKEDGKYRLMQLRNPWGSYGREYQYDYQNIDNDGNVPVKTKSNRNAGVFWIELSEVTKYFDGLSIGAKIPTD